MSVTVFASVYIGSFEISLKIFEFSQKNKMKEIDHVRARNPTRMTALAMSWLMICVRFYANSKT